MNPSRRILPAVLAVLALVLVGLSPRAVAGDNSPGQGQGQGGSARPTAMENAGIDIVVRINSSRGTPEQLERDYPVTLLRTLLASRDIYLVRPTDPFVHHNAGQATALAKRMSRGSFVSYAEPNFATELADSRYHSWPNGVPEDAGSDSEGYRSQPLVSRLGLAEAHQLSKGAGTTVAVLDTGVALDHPALAGRLVPGYDYVDDDSDPSEASSGLDGNGNGVSDEAFGHGTFVAGIVALVAPEARVMPMRVLDSDGGGTVFLVAQAILDAVDDGATVINISLGTPEKLRSKLINDVIEYAMARQVHVVAAAGNAASDVYQYPANNEGVLSVTSVKMTEDSVSDFANFGDWVDVASPGDRVLGPVPGGRYAWWAGTSMAAPQVSAQLALLRARGVTTIDKQLKAVEDTTRKVHGKKVHYGAVNIPASLRKSSGK